MSFDAIDHQFMAHALQLARRGVCTTDPNPNVGCVLVAAGQVVGEGWHERAGEAHAEVAALAQAGAAASGATVYVTLEPCSHHGRTPPCAEALIAAGVARVICAMQDPNPQVAGTGLDKLRAAGIEVQCGLLEADARALNRGFISRMERKRPFVRVKVAASMDGRTALASSESQWITGPAARADVHRMRAQSSAILTGIGTVLADDPQLTSRCDELDEVLQPLRVIVDSALRTPLDAKIVTGNGAVRIYHCSGDAAAVAALESAGATVVQMAGTGAVDLAAMLHDLAGQGINDVMVEAGVNLNGALLAAGLIDEWVIYQAAKIMGADAQGMFGINIPTMSEAIELQLTDVRHIGNDLRLTYRMEK